MLPEWAAKYEDEDHVVRKRGNKYYLYEYEIEYLNDLDNVYEPLKTKRVLSKVSSARITKDGLIKNKNKKKPQELPIVISTFREYGASHLLDVLCSDILDNLKKYFKDDGLMIYIMAKQILIEYPVIDSIDLNYQSSNDFIHYPNLRFPTSSILSLLHKITHNRLSRYQFVHDYMDHQNYYMFINSYELDGYIMRFLYCFQNETFSYFRSFHIDKSVNETIKNAITELKCQNIIWIGEDENDIQLLHGIPYIISIDYDKEIGYYENHFIYDHRDIYYQIINLSSDKLILYDDSDHIMFYQNRQIPLALKTNCNEDVSYIYEMYMNKDYAQDRIDLYYNLLENNFKYIHDYNEVGFLFIYYLSTLMCSRIDQRLQGTDLAADEVIDMLKEVKIQIINYESRLEINPNVDLSIIKEKIPECEL
ncbi:MAG: hypothetical protein LUG60_14030 [Erysipelotrichaceae bacterium]|nr:hypothetical protein [Erysipelotrichaceae bacterium]